MSPNFFLWNFNHELLMHLNLQSIIHPEGRVAAALLTRSEIQPRRVSSMFVCVPLSLVSWRRSAPELPSLLPSAAALPAPARLGGGRCRLTVRLLG